MSRSQRIIESVTHGIYNDAMRQTGATSLMSTERNHQRTRNLATEQYEEALDETVELTRKNRELQAQLEDCEDIINFWANNNETFRRTLHYLKDNWQPKDGAEASIKKVVGDKRQEVKQDQNWPEEKKQTNKRLADGRREAQKRKPRVR